MAVDLLPTSIRNNYEIYGWKHACSILAQDFPIEFRDIIEILSAFTLKKPDILRPGGGKSK